MSHRGFVPEFIWLLVYKCSPDQKQPESTAYKAKYEAVSQFQEIVQSLKAEHPLLDWLADTEDKNGKTKYKLVAKSTDYIFVGLTKVRLI